MAGFRTHITVSTLCGAAYGGALFKALGHTPETCVLAASLTAVGGMVPDLDSDSGVPVREMTGLAAAVTPLLLFTRFTQLGLSHEGVIACMVGMYVLVRYGVAYLFKHITVHRGMFHSVPAMLITGLVVYLSYETPNRTIRLLFALGAMIGFLSHLILDEIYSVDFNGIRIKLKGSAGSAVKFFSKSVAATSLCYTILGALAFLVWVDLKSTGQPVEKILLSVNQPVQ